ncbi:6-phosphofructo-2-kinase/fructose-2,6-bisphosphatase-like isoform X2 [Xenopus laevis]|uniref:6-phosphofructo-2-kinase/fructose-2, 6-bisphosphatase-like isoform X2 n=1 Tax=Xenopus laevis TaxID=8355 RepID=A0A8J1LY12_XENLA|nr:6-phosphofructo-2-kinase/fructose-2,6-bisphosphatase-like isoform X2 [Xenopus laevis]
MAEILRELKQTRQQKIWIPHQCERLQQRRGSSIPQFTNSPTMTNIFKKFTHYLNWIRIPTKVLNVGQREVVQTYKNFEFFLLDNQEAMKIRNLPAKS